MVQPAAKTPLSANAFQPGALPSNAVCRRARQSRDPRFDGRFIVAVRTTGIYCRPICPARMPREDNVSYFVTAAAAQDAGYRPCRRCRPESALSLPEWTMASDTVMRGLRMIENGWLSVNNTAELAAALQVSERHLTRLFQQELGTTPKSIARWTRARLAKGLLASSSMNMADVAFHAGYGSLSRFNQEIRDVFGQTPSMLRKAKGKRLGETVRLTLSIRGPYHFDWVFAYLHKRALAGLEEVIGEAGCWCFRRRFDDSEGQYHWVEVYQQAQALQVVLPLTDVPLHSLLTRIRRVFDLQADGETIHEFLCKDARLGEVVRAAPGLRVPGAWEGFETAVRAVLGQQVSVTRGTVLANKMVASYGEGCFPSPEQLCDQQVGELGMPGRRGQAIALLARQVRDGNLGFDDSSHFDQVQQQLQAIAGIGPWTANYIRMRVLKDPDAFPDNDWVVLKVLQCTAAKARAQANAWSPWRAYALMYLWYSSSLAVPPKALEE
jgi:AraC family transcriptional regulator of adaptative response / DNA-3-methyladenine glycosylase II